MATVARNYAQDDVHPLLRHPRPIKRDPAKANRMLGYLADSEEALKGLHREKSVTTRWLERPLYEQREAAEAEEERKQPKAEPIPEIEAKEEPKPLLSLQSVKIIQENGNDDSDSDLLDKWTNPDRPTSSFNPETSLRKLPDAEPISKLDTSFVTQRPLLNTRPASYNPRHLLTPEWTASPSTMGPETASPPRAPSCLESIEKLRSALSSQDSCECYQPNPVMWSSQLAQKAKDAREERPVSYHPQSFTSLETPAVQQRPRPTSFANYNQRNRSGTKIASSRGLRKDSFPTKSRPPSGTIPKAIAGENIENDQVYQRFGDDEVGPPTPLKSISPAMPPPSVFSATPVTPASSTFDSFDKFEHLEEKPKPEKEKKAKNRWSTIPQALKNFSARRRDSSAASHDTPKFANVVDDLRRLKLTEENLHSYEHEANRFSVAPRRQSTLGLPTPEYSPFDPSTNRSAPQLGAPLPAPFAPWATDAPPSPSATIDYQHRRRSSGLSLSPKPTPLGLRVESPHSPQQQQYHYHNNNNNNNNQARPSSMHSPRSTPTSAFPSPHHASTFPTQQYHHYTNSPRPTTSDTPRIGTPASRRNTPAVERTCIQCKTTKPNTEFVSRRITGNCWHEPATCAACLHAWITRCAAGAGARGIDACSCPECGEAMSRDDVYGLMGGMTGGSPP